MHGVCQSVLSHSDTTFNILSHRTKTAIAQASETGLDLQPSAAIKSETDEAFWETSAARAVRSYVALTWMEGQSEAAIADRICQHPVGKAEPSRGTKHVGVVFIGELAGEAITKLHVRHGPLNEEALVKLCRASLKGRSGLDQSKFDSVNRITPGDVYIFSDAGILGPHCFYVNAYMIL